MEDTLPPDQERDQFMQDWYDHCEATQRGYVKDESDEGESTW